MTDRIRPGLGHALADRLREAGRIMSEVREAMVLAEMPYVLSQELWELEDELKELAFRHGRELGELEMRLRTLAVRVEAEDEIRRKPPAQR
jgi:hypothetical protein